jgi:hypothetical protein
VSSKRLGEGLQRTIGNRAIQRLLYKDNAAKDEGRPYNDVRKTTWLQKKPKPHQALALRAHKQGNLHLTLDEVDAKLADAAGFERELEEMEQQSGFISGVVDEAVAERDRIVEPAEFERMAPKGVINPYRLRTAQGGIELHFREKEKGKITDLVTKLVATPTMASTIPPVGLAVHENKVWSFDTRRVVAFQMAQEQLRAKNPDFVLSIPYVKLATSATEERVGSIYTPRPGMGIITAVRYQGLGSTSEPWINPAYRGQLEHVISNWEGPEGFKKQGAEAVVPNQVGEVGRVVNVPGTGMNCLISAILVAGKIAHKAKLVRQLRRWLIDQHGGDVAQFNQPLEAQNAGVILISYLEGIHWLKPHTGLVVYTPYARHVLIGPYQEPDVINLWLSGGHFQAIVAG